MKKMKDSFGNMKLANKFLTVFFVFMIIYSIIVYIAFKLTLNIYDEKLYEKSLQELDFYIQNINEDLKDLENLSYTIVMDEGVQQQLSIITDSKIDEGRSRYELNKFKQAMILELNNNDFFKNITYLYDDDTKFNVGIDVPIQSDDGFEEFFSKIERARGGYVTKNPTPENPYLISGRNILKYTDNSLDYLGTLVFTSDISEIFENQIKELETESSDLYVFSEDGIIFQSNEEIKIDFENIDVKNKYEKININNEKYFMCYLTSSKNNWTYINIFPYSKIYGQIDTLKKIVLVGIIFMFLILLIVLKKVSNIVTQPLENLIESMKVLETGDFEQAKEVLGEVETTDEVGQLNHEFAVAINSIQELIHENYEKELNLKDVEYKMLQAQMNPHFIYNTLNTINWLIRGNKNEDAVRMTIEFGEVLRASFARKRCSTVEEDLNLAKSYICIQQYRYKSRINFIINDNGDLDEYIIPFITIQPLIENSIQHGAGQSLEPIQISVNVVEEQDSIRISVSDTGVGMTSSELESVRNFTTSKGNGIGLKNVSERLKMQYTDSEFRIESEEGVGTTVYIKIPKVNKDVL